MVFFRWMPNLLDIHIIHTCQFFDNFETCFLCKLVPGLSASVKLQHKWQTCKVRKCTLAVLKNIQFPDLWSIRPTGQVREGKLTLWLGSFKNTNVWDISKRNVHYTIVMKYMSHFLRLVSFSDANISLDLYLRFLSKNEYLGLNCMWWKSTWWPWVTRWRKYMLWCLVRQHTGRQICDSNLLALTSCRKWWPKGFFLCVGFFVTTFQPFCPLCVKDLWMLMSFWGFWYNKCVIVCVCVHDQKWCLRRFFCQYESA